MRAYLFKFVLAIVLSQILLTKVIYANQVINYESGFIESKINILNGSIRMPCTNKLRCSLSQTTTFYINHQFAQVWILNGKIRPEALQLLSILDNSYQNGLNPADYHVNEINDLIQKAKLDYAQNISYYKTLADLEVTLSDAYLLYMKHMSEGRINPQFSYQDWQVSRARSLNILELYNNALITNTVISTLNKLEPNYPGYNALKEKLAEYQKIAKSGGWQTIPRTKDLKLGIKDKSVILVEKRLALTGDYTGEISDDEMFTKNLQNAVSQFQTNNGLKANGVINKTTLQALNIPVESRIKTIQLNMDRLRWLPNDLDANYNYILVNIPNYSLSIIENNNHVMDMPVIVGGGGINKTCVVNSKITNLELNPYWGIPNRIATKEYLANIQKNPAYLAAHDIKVYDLKTRKQIDESQIDWQSTTQNNFNYFLRQDPGKKNALGKIKFLFNNDCGIYLHDTSSRNLFSNKLRSLSHGCVRVSQPSNLANYLLKSESAWNEAKLESAIQTGKHRWVKINQSVEIHIVYLTSWVNESGNLQFRNDIYKADNVNFPVYLPKDKADQNMIPST